MNWVDLLAWFILASGFFLACVGTIVPALPGVLFVVIGLFAHEYLRPETYTWLPLLSITILSLISWLIDFLSGLIGAKLGGASRGGLIGASLGGFIGIFAMPLGLILGPFIGAILGDLFYKRREVLQLLKSGTGAALGFVISLFIRFFILLIICLILILGALI